MEISLQSKFQPNRTSGYRVMAILFKFWPKFGPSLGTLGPISKKFVRGLPPTMAGFVPKFQPSVTKTVGGVCIPRNKMATILYMYRLMEIIFSQTKERPLPFCPAFKPATWRTGENFAISGRDITEMWKPQSMAQVSFTCTNIHEPYCICTLDRFLAGPFILWRACINHINFGLLHTEFTTSILVNFCLPPPLQWLVTLEELL